MDILTAACSHRVPDLPATAGITSSNLLAFGILWLLQLPFAFVHPSKINIVFRIKSVLAPIGLIATMIWALVSKARCARRLKRSHYLDL